MHRGATDEVLHPEENRKMADRKMVMLHLGTDHFSVPHLSVNSPLLA
tara:strand:- start:11583 stop:11723 length:141 start_codon:yes stop_codon:yes gene_type:complete